MASKDKSKGAFATKKKCSKVQSQSILSMFHRQKSINNAVNALSRGATNVHNDNERKSSCGAPIDVGTFQEHSSCDMKLAENGNCDDRSHGPAPKRRCLEASSNSEKVVLKLPSNDEILCDDWNRDREVSMINIEDYVVKTDNKVCAPTDIDADVSIQVVDDVQRKSLPQTEALPSSQITDTDEVHITPYYLDNFRLIISSVMEDTYNEGLFDSFDFETVETFNLLSEPTQKLYVRLFLRKHRWLLSSRIRYPQIADDLSVYFGEMHAAGLAVNENELTDLTEILKLMPVPNLRNLAKSLQIKKKLSQGELVTAMVEHVEKSHLSKFLNQSSTHLVDTLRRRAKTELGCCWRLEQEKARVFTRLVRLFSLHTTAYEEDEPASQQTFHMLLVNRGEVRYPDYRVWKVARVFACREALLAWDAATSLEREAQAAIETKAHDAVVATMEKVLDLYTHIEASERAHDASLPSQLCMLTRGATLVRVLALGVDALQKLRHYERAVSVLQVLVTEPLYHVLRRSRWYERLALNQEQRLKQPAEALVTCVRALGDGTVRGGRRLALLQRATRLAAHRACEQARAELGFDLENDVMAHVPEPQPITIRCRQAKAVATGDPAAPLCRFMTEDSFSSGEMTLHARVEDVVLEHYRARGYPAGLHSESRVFTLLFTLLTWDIVFECELPDVFHSPYQLAPLDLRTDEFYRRRRELFTSRLAEIDAMSVDELCAMLRESWVEHEGVSCIGVNWDLFTDAEECCSLLRCLGSAAVAGILACFARDYRHSTGGMPDLVLWNPDTGAVKLCEVKGPGDRLSTKQILWLDYLNKELGLDAEVCRVEAVSAKRLTSSK